MLNKLWPIFLIISIMYAIFTGNIEKLNNSIFESADNAVNLTITLFGTLCFWNGIMQIAMKSSLVETISKLLNPLIKLLFPEIKKGEKVHKEISMNMTANMLGLGNAATPLGLNCNKKFTRFSRTKQNNISSVDCNNMCCNCCSSNGENINKMWKVGKKKWNFRIIYL